uniref:Transcriptional adapter ADA2b isoform X2 n=1 Tax=Rhizophora mucronata TaxID=61149 RepID=A0A2P2M3M1_RHIMU
MPSTWMCRRFYEQPSGLETSIVYTYISMHHIVSEFMIYDTSYDRFFSLFILYFQFPVLDQVKEQVKGNIIAITATRI